MKLCDLTQFYSPLSGGVKRYVGEKVRFLRAQNDRDEHVLIIPGERDACTGDARSRTYTIRSPLVSRTSRYRVLLRLEAVERILERERPDLIESGDPYQVAWKAVASGRALGIPVVGFYHSHFPEAYVRTAQKFCGSTITGILLDLCRRYVRALYGRFERTIVPSPALGAVLAAWGVRNVVHSDLGVDVAVFQPQAAAGEDLRAELAISGHSTLLLYVGRLAQEKNTHTLFAAFGKLADTHPGRFHLIVAGDGLQRKDLAMLGSQLSPSAVTHLPYISDPRRLAAWYRAADVFVHPGVQETFGLVALEAQACGTPVVGIRGSYMDRIIHCGQALWAPANTPGALAAAIEEAARIRKPDAASRLTLHRQIAGRYAWEQIFTRLFAIYRDVIATWRPR